MSYILRNNSRDAFHKQPFQVGKRNFAFNADRVAALLRNRHILLAELERGKAVNQSAVRDIAWGISENCQRIRTAGLFALCRVIFPCNTSGFLRKNVLLTTKILRCRSHLQFSDTP